MINLDPSFPVTDNPVQSAIIVGDVLYIAGLFIKVGGLDRSNLAAINIKTKQVLPWNPIPLGKFSNITSISHYNGVIYAVGDFNTNFAGGNRLNAAAWDLQGNLTAWDPAPTEPMYVVNAQPEGVYVGGRMLFINRAPGVTARQYLGLVNHTDGTVNPYWFPRPTGPVQDILALGSLIYFVGEFDTVGDVYPNIFTRNGAAAVPRGGGSILATPTAWDPNLGVGGKGYALTHLDGKTYIGGNFSTCGGASHVNLAAVDSGTGVVDAGFTTYTSAPVTTVENNGEKIYVGGYFSGATAVRGNTFRYYAFFCEKDGTVTDDMTNMSAPVLCAAFGSTGFYIGGYFTTYFGNTIRHGIFSTALAENGGAALKFAPEFYSPIGGGVLGVVNAVAVDNGILYAAGAFSTVKGANGTFTRNGLAALDELGNVLAWDPNISSISTYAAKSLLIDGDTVYVGGRFRTIGGVNRTSIAALDKATGSVKTAFNANLNPYLGTSADDVLALAMGGGALFIGGNFIDLNGTSILGVAKLDPETGVLDATWDAGIRNTSLANNAPQIQDLYCDGTNLYIVGSLDLKNVTDAASGFAAMSVASPATDPGIPVFLDGTYVPGQTTGVGVTVEGSKIFVAGRFDSVTGANGAFPTIKNAVAFDLSGNIDAAWAPNPNGTASVFSFGSGVVYAVAASSVWGSSTRGLLVALDTAGNFLGYEPKPNILGVQGQTLAISGSAVYCVSLTEFLGIVYGITYLAAFQYPIPALPMPPRISFLNRVILPDGRQRTVLKWEPVVYDTNNNPTEVTAYNIYRSSSANTEDVALIAQVYSVDLRGFVDCIFSEVTDGFYQYCVTAISAVGESGKSCVTRVSSQQYDRYSA